MALANEGVGALPMVGLPTRVEPGVVYMEPGRARREGDLPFGGRGEVDLGGAPVPTNFF